MNWETVIEFEKKIAEFFGAPFAVATDSCTHGIELCLRYKQAEFITCPRHTYLSIPMLASKLNIDLTFVDDDWQDYYWVHSNIIDAAVLWRKDSYVHHSLMCLSFQYQKHLSLGRAGMILCPTKEIYNDLKKMSYDGRLPNIPWRDQNIQIEGFHYYCQPELAALGLEKLQKAIETEPRKWTINDWPDLTTMDIWKK